MATKTKATHRGNCQVCGRQQHVTGTVLAKHGYTVDYGYFNGTCRGSDRQPVQTERTLTDATIEGLNEYALGCDTSADNFRTGVSIPSRIKTGGKFNQTTRRYEPIYISWNEGTPDQQAAATERTIAGCERDARHARAHARSLKKMADELHGTSLVSIDDFRKAADEAKARRAAKPTVDVKAATVSGAFGSKAARKEELDKINRLYSKQIDALQAIYLALPSHERELGKRTEVYYAPMYPHQWKPKHSALALKEFPQAAAIVAEIEQLVAARNAVKAAP